MPTERSAGARGGIDSPMTWRAFAKVNEELRVFGRQADGYHEVRTVLRTIDLADEIHIAPAARFRFSTTSGPADETNLVVRAFRAFERTFGRDLAFNVHLVKNIPAGAGLGGGSADAAVTLMGLHRFVAPDLSGADLAGMLQSMGADVPFFAVGGQVLAIGRGDVLFPLGVGTAPSSESEERYVLVHAPLAVSTAQAYSWLDEYRAQGTIPEDRDPVAGEPHSGLTEIPEYTTIFGFCARFVPALGAADPGRARCLNDFESPLFQRFPELAEIKGRLLAAGARRAAVTGSGSTVFGYFRNPAVAEEAARALGIDYGVSVVGALGRREYLSRLFGP